MNRITRYIGTLTVLALLVAWAGAWAAWVPHRSLGLTQNAIDLAEWSTFLPEVRFGGLRTMPEMLRLAITLCSVALAVGPSRTCARVGTWTFTAGSSRTRCFWTG